MLKFYIIDYIAPIGYYMSPVYFIAVVRVRVK